VNGTEHNWDYQGKENQEELGLNWHDFGARNYDAYLGRWMNVDPLAEEFYSYSTYNAMMNDPINFIDPDGRSADWIPKLNEDGSTSYIAEQGDSASTLSSQYGISQGDAEAITGTTGDTEIAEGTEISGETINNVTGSEVLKLDLNSKEGKSSQRRFDQYLYGADRSRSKGEYSFSPKEYFQNINLKDEISGKANINIDGQNISLIYNIPLTRPGTFDGSSNSVRLDNSPLTTKQTSGVKFQNQTNIYLPLYHPNTNNRMGNYSIFSRGKDVNKIFDRLKKPFPEYNYIRIPQAVKN